MPAFLSHFPAKDEAHAADVLVVPVSEPLDGLVLRLGKIGRGIGDARFGWVCSARRGSSERPPR